MIEFDYRIEPKHLAAYQREVMKRITVHREGSGWSSENVRAIALTVLAGGAILLVAYFLPRATGEPLQLPELVAGIVIGGLIVVGVLAVLFHGAALARVKPGGPTLSKHTLTVTSEGLKIEGPAFESLHRWTAIEEVGIYETIIVAWVEPGAGVVVPRTAFARPLDEQAYINAANARISESRLPRAGTFGG